MNWSSNQELFLFPYPGFRLIKTMKKIIFFLLLFLVNPIFSDEKSDSDLLFDFAEIQFPDLFSPSKQSSQIENLWYYRYYPDTDTYIGSYITSHQESSVFVLGNAFGQEPLDVGLLSELLSTYLPILSVPLNDTGQIFCSDGENNDADLDCPLNGFSGQDAEFGRDSTHLDDIDGHAGFNFTKLDHNGNVLHASASLWSCVKDNTTGLIWEVKTDDSGLRDKSWTYTWYNSSGQNDGGHPGISNTGLCYDTSYCDTEKYIEQVNTKKLCGLNNWKLPSTSELISIVSMDRYKPSIDTNYFPHTVSNFYWTNSASAENPVHAWTVDFYRGDWFQVNSSKSAARNIRLVHFEQ